MYQRVNCFDVHGNSIDGYTQWDVNQTIYIDDWKYDSTPVFQFCNTKSNEALVTRGSIEEDGRAKAKVPNILLQEAYPIIVFVYLENGEAGNTIYTSQIPVRKKPKPDDYEYKENIEYVSWVKLEDEARAFMKDLENFKNDYEAALGTARENADRAIQAYQEAKASEENAKDSEGNAKDSENNAKISEENAKASEESAKSYKESADISLQNTKKSENNAKTSELEAKKYEESAKSYASNAANAANEAATNAAEEVLRQAKESGEFDGESVTVVSMTESTLDGGSNTIVFSDGNIMMIRNGKKGSSPIKGVDYYTPDEREQMVANAAQLVPFAKMPTEPLFANGKSEMTDTSNVYVNMKTGTFWQYTERTSMKGVTITDNIVATSDNQYLDSSRLGSSGDSFTTTTAEVGYHVTPMIDLTKREYQGKTIQIHLEGCQYASTGNYAQWIQARTYGLDKSSIVESRMYVCDTNLGGAGLIDGKNGTMLVTYNSATSATITINVPPTNGSARVPIGYLRFCGKGAVADSKISITYEVEEVVTETDWFDTGISYAPNVTEEDMKQLANDVAALIDNQILAMIGTGEVEV